MLLESCNDNEWQQKEQEWIARYDDLTNATIGGKTAPKSALEASTGESNKSAKLTESQVIEIKGLILQGLYTTAQIGFEFGVSDKQVSAIAREEYWRGVGPDVREAYKISKRKSRQRAQTPEKHSKLTTDMVILILTLVADGLMYKDAAAKIEEEYGVTIDTSSICHIVKGRKWKGSVEMCSGTVKNIILEKRQ